MVHSSKQLYEYHPSTWSMNVLSKCVLPLASCQRRNGKGQLHNWWKMTLLQLYNHPASPLLSLSPCRNSHIRRPLSCLFCILHTIFLYSNGLRTLKAIPGWVIIIYMEGVRQLTGWCHQGGSGFLESGERQWQDILTLRTGYKGHS